MGCYKIKCGDWKQVSWEQFLKFIYIWICFSNLRFAAYRSMFFWMFGKKRPKKKFRSALPNCLVSLIRQKFPSETYTGFINKLPSIILQSTNSKDIICFFIALKRRRKDFNSWLIACLVILVKLVNVTTCFIEIHK